MHVHSLLSYVYATVILPDFITSYKCTTLLSEACFIFYSMLPLLYKLQSANLRILKVSPLTGNIHLQDAKFLSYFSLLQVCNTAYYQVIML